MKFELTQEIIDQIIFGMENQESAHLFDAQEQRLTRDGEVIDQVMDETEAFEDRYLPLPEWRSVDGYNLMEGFVASLHNPLYRENLRNILQGGKGVFRLFKDALKERKDIERLWFRFKQKEMRRRVNEWYNELREYWGMVPLSADPETETEDLLLADFEFNLAEADLSTALAVWDRSNFKEMFPQLEDEELTALWHERRSNLPQPASNPESPVLAAKTPLGEIAGFLWAVENKYENGTRVIGRIIQLAVASEYRGLGLAGALLNNYCDRARERGFKAVIIEVPVGSEFMGASLEPGGFKTYSTMYRLEL